MKASSKPLSINFNKVACSLLNLINELSLRVVSLFLLYSAMLYNPV